MARKRMAKYIGLKLPGTFDNLSVCMFYRFRQVQTELSDVKLGGELNHPKLTPILNMQLLLSIIGGLHCIPMLIYFHIETTDCHLLELSVLTLAVLANVFLFIL